MPLKDSEEQNKALFYFCILTHAQSKDANKNRNREARSIKITIYYYTRTKIKENTLI